MSRSVIPPLDAGATAPEALSLLHQRLLMAEEQTEALVKDMDTLGVSREQILERVEGELIQRPVSPLKMHHALREPGGEGLLWRQCDGLVTRVCRMESLLQTLKLATFRFSTERELDPSHSARLKEQISTLQRESEEEQRASRREVMRLRDQLRRACLDRDKAQGEVQELGEALEVATASKMDVALAVEELKTVKVQMNEKLLQLKDQMYQESVRSSENEKYSRALLQRVEEMERVVELERSQARIVQGDCQALRSDGQNTRQRLQEEEDRALRLQEQCDQLKGQAEVKDSLVLELTGELKSVRLALQKQQRDNSGHLKDIGDLKTKANEVLALNSQLESQCSDWNSALRSLTLENSKLQTEHQASIMTERTRVSQQLEEQDLLLEAAKRNMQTELQGALSAKVKMQMELETLKVDHNQLLQSSMVAQEKAVAQQSLLEWTIERLQGELTTAVKDGEVMRQDRDSAKTEMYLMVTKLEGEKSSLVTQLAKVKLDSVTFQKQAEENRRLMGKLTAMELQQDTQQQVEQMLRKLTDGNNKLAYEKGSLQVSSEMDTLRLTCQGLEAQLRQAQGELASATAARNEALRDGQILRARLDQLQERHKRSKLEGRLGLSHQQGGSVAQTLGGVLASHSRLQRNTETLQQELGGREQELVTLRRDRLQAQRKIQRLQLEVEKLQDIMTTAPFEKTKMLEPLQIALDVTRLDNKKLARSLEQAVLDNSTLKANLDQVRQQHQNSSKLRESELLETRAEIGRLSELLETMKIHMKKERASAKRLSQREISELRKALEDSLLRSDDLSRANRQLQEKISELEKVVSNQKACLRVQKTQLQQHLDNSAALNTKKIKASTEAKRKSLEVMKEKSQNNFLQSHQIQMEMEAERELRCAMQDKCQRLEGSIEKLLEAKEKAELNLKEVCLESQQISANLEEAHSWFRFKFNNLKEDAEPNRCNGDEAPQETEHHGPGSSEGMAHLPCRHDGKIRCKCTSREPDGLERWTATMQRWETKRELARIARGYNPGGPPSLAHSH